MFMGSENVGQTAADVVWIVQTWRERSNGYSGYGAVDAILWSRDL